MPGQSQLFSLDYDRSGETAAAAGMGKSSSAPSVQNTRGYNPVYSDDMTAVQLINAVHDFQWTHTPAHGRHQVPYIRMSEMKVKFNSIRQQLRYMLTGTGQQGGIGGDEQKRQHAADAAFNKDKTGIKDPSNIQRHLKAYFGLYGVQPTGFEYVFPYLTDAHKSITNQWGSIEGTDQGGPVSKLLDTIAGESGFIQDAVNTLAIQDNVVGTYINRPKMYGSDTEGPSVTFGLDLFNTETFEDVVRNWHLCFLLSYMNLPNQKTRVQSDPPVIYEVEVPGVFYSPFTYISNLQITHRGSTRVMKVPYWTNYDSIVDEKGEQFSVGSADSWHRFSDIQKELKRDTLPRKVQSYQTGISKKMAAAMAANGNTVPNTYIGKQVWKQMTIPDAYHIDITLTSMIPETQNLYFHSILGNNTRGHGLYNVYISDPNEREGAARENMNRTRAPIDTSDGRGSDPHDGYHSTPEG